MGYACVFHSGAAYSLHRVEGDLCRLHDYSISGTWSLHNTRGLLGRGTSMCSSYTCYKLVRNMEVIWPYVTVLNEVSRKGCICVRETNADSRAM